MNNSGKQKCLIIINRRSGNASRINRKALIKTFGEGSRVTFRFIDTDRDKWSAEGFDRLVICGGDGTFNNALNNIKGQNIEVYYYPCGTLNEFSKTVKHHGRFVLRDAGTLNGRIFSYVAAAGSFTPLGYAVDEKYKKRFKIFAYLYRVIKEYKIYNIKAQIDCGNSFYEGEYSLIMVLDSKRCFGFRFNRMYKPDDGLFHLLLIKSPGGNNLLNKIRMFFPFFRAFFIGFGKNYISKNIIFIPIKGAEITLAEQTDFCVDGEKVTEYGNVKIAFANLDSHITVLGKIK